MPFCEPIGPLGREILDSNFAFKPIYGIGFFIAIVVCVGLLFRSLYVVDACLDGGGCWDDERKVCELENPAPCEPKVP